MNYLSRGLRMTMPRRRQCTGRCCCRGADDEAAAAPKMSTKTLATPTSLGVLARSGRGHLRLLGAALLLLLLLARDTVGSSYSWRAHLGAASRVTPATHRHPRPHAATARSCSDDFVSPSKRPTSLTTHATARSSDATTGMTRSYRGKRSAVVASGVSLCSSSSSMNPQPGTRVGRRHDHRHIHVVTCLQEMINPSWKYGG
jgi:hypothetical protein